MENKKPGICPVCLSKAYFWKEKTSKKIRYRIEKCDNCGHAFVNPRPSFDEIAAFYSNSEQNKKEYTVTEETIINERKKQHEETGDAHDLIKEIENTNTNKECKAFLDVGCGSGFFSKEATEKGFDVVSLELSSGKRAIAKKLLGKEPLATSFEDYDSEQRFSVILMSQILEHVVDINLWIRKANWLLAREGVLVISLPNFNSVFRFFLQEKDPFICPPIHLNFFNSKSIKLLLEKHGFRIKKIENISRIPSSVLEKRIPGLFRTTVPAWTLFANILLKIMNLFHMGMMINVFAVKKENVDNER